MLAANSLSKVNIEKLSAPSVLSPFTNECIIVTDFQKINEHKCIQVYNHGIKKILIEVSTYPLTFLFLFCTFDAISGSDASKYSYEINLPQYVILGVLKTWPSKSVCQKYKFYDMK